MALHLHATENMRSVMLNASTGDCYLCCGNGASVLTEMYLATDYSHCAMIVTPMEGDDLYKHIYEDGESERRPAAPYFLWEAVRDHACIYDYITKTRRGKGTRLVALEDVLCTETCEFSAYVAHLVEPCSEKPAVERIKMRNNMLLPFFIEMAKHKYDDRWMTFVLAGYDGPLGQNAANDDRVICSDSMCRAYIALNMLPKNINTREVTPVDLTRMSFSRGIYLAPPEKIADSGVEPIAYHIESLLCVPCTMSCVII